MTNLRLLEDGEEVKMSPKFFSLLKFMIDQRVQQEQGSEVARVIIFEGRLGSLLAVINLHFTRSYQNDK